MVSLLRGYPVAVGDTVILKDVNHRKGTPHPEYVVTAIGPKRLRYVAAWGREQHARLSDGHVSDWTHVTTVAESIEQEARLELVKRLRELGLEFRMGRGRDIPTKALADVVNVLEFHLYEDGVEKGQAVPR